MDFYIQTAFKEALRGELLNWNHIAQPEPEPAARALSTPRVFPVQIASRPEHKTGGICRMETVLD